MKKIVGKNQVIVTALAIMIVVAGYLNFTGQEITTSGLVSSQNKEQAATKGRKRKKIRKRLRKRKVQGILWKHLQTARRIRRQKRIFQRKMRERMIIRSMIMGKLWHLRKARGGSHGVK